MKKIKTFAKENALELVALFGCLLISKGAFLLSESLGYIASGAIVIGIVYLINSNKWRGGE